MRLALTAVLVVGLSAAAAAQSSTPSSAGTPPRGTIGLPLPPIGLPLSPIGLPLPRIGLPPIGVTPGMTAQQSNHPPQQGQHRPGQPRPGQPGQHRPGPRGPGRTRQPAAIYFIPTGALGYPTAPAEFPATPSVREEQESPAGSLRLEFQPGVDPQLFVDGYFVGTLSDVGSELTLDAGPHTLDVTADGYERLQFGVQIPADRSITYRGALKPFAVALTPAPRPAAAPLPPPATIYVIAGCYVGNVPPRDAHLPTGCDAARVTILAPPKR